MDEFIATVGLGGRASRRRERVPADTRNIIRVSADRGATAMGLGGSAAGARWGGPNQCELQPACGVAETAQTLRECVESSPEHGLSP